MNKITVATMGMAIIFVYQTGLLAQTNKIEWSSLNMGFAETSSSNTKVTSVIGQSFVDISGGGDTQITSGFLSFIIVDFETSVEEPTETGIPNSFELFQNYPNPFNPSTTIAFSLPRESEVKLKLFDILGREITLIVNRKMPAGHHKVIFDATSLSSGVYFYRLEAEGFVKARKLTLLK